MAAHKVFQIVFYVLLFMCSSALLGLTAYRVSYTQWPNGYRRSSVIELLSASVIGVILSVAMVVAIPIRRRCSIVAACAEMFFLVALWFMFLVGAATLATNGMLIYCRGWFNQCGLLRSIDALSWVNWLWVTILLPLSLVSAFSDSEERSPKHRPATGMGTQTQGTYEHSRETTNLNTESVV